MPMYEYRCQDCGELSEVLQRFDDPPLETCPECGGTVKKLISAPAFQFKGSGWYVTDYARKSADAGSKGAEEKDKGAGGAEAGGSDSRASGDSSKTTDAAATGGKAETSTRSESSGKSGETSKKSAATGSS